MKVKKVTAASIFFIVLASMALLALPAVAEAGRGHHRHGHSHHHHHYDDHYGHHHHHHHKRHYRKRYRSYYDGGYNRVYAPPRGYYNPYPQPRYGYNYYPPAPVYSYPANVMFGISTGNADFMFQY